MFSDTIKDRIPRLCGEKFDIVKQKCTAKG